MIPKQDTRDVGEFFFELLGVAVAAIGISLYTLAKVMLTIFAIPPKR